MERTITYKITDSGQNIRIDSFLRKHGYSMQNLTLLKKMPESILKNGEWSYMQTTLQAGDILTVRIQEETSSPNIPAVNLPIDIVYEDEDIIVINPGSLSYPRQEGRRPTFVMMEIDAEGEVHFELEYV